MAETRLRALVLGRVPELELDPQALDDARAARGHLREVLAIEERLDIVLGNLLEWEEHLLSTAAADVIYSEGSWSAWQGKVHLTNRRLMNLLSSCTLYIDHLRHSVSTLFGKDSDEYSSVLKWMSEQYDARLGYRSMVALRNFFQHRGWGVHHINRQSWRVGETAVWKNSFTPSIQPSYLKEEGGFKASVLEELEAEGETVALPALVRDFISGLTEVHTKVRELVAPLVETADDLVSGHVQSYLDAGAQHVAGLAVVLQEEGRVLDSVSIQRELSERRKELERRNRRLPNLKNQFVTTVPKDLPTEE